MKRIGLLQQKDEKLVVGLLSGTSGDGIDVALVRIRGHGLAMRAETIAFRTVPFPDVHRDRIRNLASADAETICRYNFILGELFSSAALALLDDAGVPRESVDLVGSHGQTVVHVPRGPHEKGATMQIGEGDVIAERLGVPVVSDFRTRDVAAGGEGAPLAAYVDYLLFRSEGPPRLTLNLGGIANLTLVTRTIEEVFAFDTGPANMPMDDAVRLLTHGKEQFDRDGKRAADGRVDQNLLVKLASHSYLSLPPPKTTGREMFGVDFVLPLLRSKGASTAHDVIATLTAFTALSISRAITEFVLPRHHPVEMLVSGGGVHNPVLMMHLKQMLPRIAVRTLDEVGIDPDAKEALLFAILANETIHGNPNNLPGATGAQWPVVLGKISP